MKVPVVALFTDFGEEDFFVASLKAVILGINPQARIVDVSHKIPSFDIGRAGFVLLAVYKYFPAGTIFLAVVDPGVGSRRKILLAKTSRYYFIAPDNGLLTMVLEEEKAAEIREVTNPQFFLPQVGKTFEGRDKMAPAAAWLSRGARLDEFGPRVGRFKKIKIPRAYLAEGSARGRILYADKFGNLMTNIPASMVDGLAGKKNKEMLSLYIGRKKIGSYKETYASARKGEVFFLIGSLGFVEIASRDGSAGARIKPDLRREVWIAPPRSKARRHG